MKSIIVITLLIGLVAAEDIFNSTSSDTAESNSTDVVEGRRRYGFGGHKSYLLWYGWLNALAILWVIKIKVFFVGAGLAWAALVAYKYFAKQNCFGGAAEYIHGSPHYETSGYSNTPPPSTGWAGGASYDGPDPYSAYSAGFHSDHSDHSDHFTGFDTSGFADHDHHHDHQDFSSPSISDTSGVDPSVAPDTAAKMRRSVPDAAPMPMPFEDIDFAEIMFIFLGVRTDECKKRFMCEMDFRARENPLTKLLHGFAKETFLRNFEQEDENEVKSFEDCGRVHPQCRAPNEAELESHDDEDKHDEVESSTSQIGNDIDNNLEEKAYANSRVRSSPLAIMRLLMKSTGR